MTEEEERIEELAQKYFSERTEINRGKIINAIYNSTLLQTITLRQLSKLSQNSMNKEELYDYQCEVTLKTVEGTLKNYKDGNFVHYLSASARGYCLNYLKDFIKHKNESSIDEMTEEKGDSFKDEKNVTADDPVADRNLDIQKKLILDTVEFFYKKTKAGRKNKALVYFYFVMDILKSYDSLQRETIIERYTFLSDNGDFVRNICKMKDISQKEYAKLTGVAESKISTLKNELMENIKEKIKTNEKKGED